MEYLVVEKKTGKGDCHHNFFSFELMSLDLSEFDEIV